jgi:hypothetical protein
VTLWVTVTTGLAAATISRTSACIAALDSEALRIASRSAPS